MNRNIYSIIQKIIVFGLLFFPIFCYGEIITLLYWGGNKIYQGYYLLDTEKLIAQAIAPPNGYAYSDRITKLEIPPIVQYERQIYKVVSIGENAFKDNKTIEELVLSENLLEVGVSAFEGCKNLRRVTVPNTLYQFCDYSFQGCTQLSKINFPSSLTNIGISAFTRCALDSIILPQSLSLIEQNAFSWNNLKYIDILSDSLTIENYAFVQCSSLECVNIHSLINWNNYIFENEYSDPTLYANTLLLDSIPITEIDLSNSSITEVPNKRFRRATTAKKLILGPNISNIGDHAFYNICFDTICSESNIPPVIDYTSFGANAYRLSKLFVPEECVPNYSSSNWRNFDNIIGYNHITTSIDFITDIHDFTIHNRCIMFTCPRFVQINDLNGFQLFRGYTSEYLFNKTGFYIINGLKIYIQ